MIRSIKVLAGDFPKSPAVYNDSSIVFNRKTKVYLIDIESYSEESGGVIEIRLFDGRRLLIEQNEAFIKTLRTALFDEPQDLEIRRQNWQQRQISGGTKVKQKIPVKNLFVVFLMAVIMIAFMKSCKEKHPSSSSGGTTQSTTQQTESKIAPGILNFKYTQKDYPKLYQRWGKSGISKINELMPKAARLVARESSCDRLEVVEISDS